MSLLERILPRLERLVAFDTQNPPRRVRAGEGIFAFLRAELGAGFTFTETDHGDGCVALLAVRGAPTVVFNAHVDTVPIGDGWTRDPLALEVTADRAIGRGAADVKGATACMLEAAASRRGDVALLFTSDEEAGSSRCVREFLKTKHGFTRAVIAEPTRCEATFEHRGIATAIGRFTGTPGHASAARALEDSAVHEAVRWASRALAFAEANEARAYKSLTGIRLNVGVLEGGVKANVIAGTATARFGVRPLPDQDPAALAREIGALAPHADRVAWEMSFVAPPLASGHDMGLEAGPPVDFWTEAALFAEAGVPSLVYGPGDIREAHTAGEWIALDQLKIAAITYASWFGETNGGK